MDFRPIAGVAHDLPGAVFDELDLIHPVVHEPDDIARDLEDRAMLAARDVESLSVNDIVWRLQDQVDGTTCIFDVEKIASCVPLAVNRQLFIEKHTGDKSGYHFLQMLHRSKVIERPNDNGGNSVRRPI